MPDQHIPHVRTPRLRLRSSRPPRSRLRSWLAGSLAAHLLALALVLFVRVVARPPEAEEPPAFGMVFEPPTDTKGAKSPTKITETPQGEETKEMHQTPQAPQSVPVPPSPQPAPPTPETQRPPEVNLLPPEYQQAPEPPPPTEQAEPVAPAERRPRMAQSRPRASPSRNPFANPMQFSYAPQARPGPSGGIRNSRSLDISAGPTIVGGRLQDAVAHVIGPGGSADWNAMLREFVEEHKYYPTRAGNNGEQGVAVVRFTVTRDGTVTALRLVSSSGSSMLDAAWMAVFRENRLPPFTDDMPEPQRTITYTMDYELIYQ